MRYWNIIFKFFATHCLMYSIHNMTASLGRVFQMKCRFLIFKLLSWKLTRRGYSSFQAFIPFPKSIYIVYIRFMYIYHTQVSVLFVVAVVNSIISQATLLWDYNEFCLCINLHRLQSIQQTVVNIYFLQSKSWCSTW